MRVNTVPMTMTAVDLPGWETDPDLRHWKLESHWKVYLGMTDPLMWTAYAEDEDLAQQYGVVYRTHGMWGLPPIITSENGDLITGNHRIRAAQLAGLKRIPRFIVCCTV